MEPEPDAAVVAVGHSGAPVALLSGSAGAALSTIGTVSGIRLGPDADEAAEQRECIILGVEKVVFQTLSLRHTPSETFSLRPLAALNSHCFQRF
jgi:hypothetical protein